MGKGQSVKASSARFPCCLFLLISQNNRYWYLLTLHVPAPIYVCAAYCEMKFIILGNALG